MKIYNKVILDKDDNVIYEDSYEYNGPIAKASGDDIKGAVAIGAVAVGVGFFAGTLGAGPLAGANLVLNGVKSSLISTALSAQYTNRDGKIFLGLFDTSKNVIADVYTLFVGKMDVMIIREGTDTSTIELKLENRLIALERPNERRMTDEDQKNLFTGDKGFEFIADLQDKQIVWGQAPE